jgi:hypothetical protein
MAAAERTPTALATPGSGPLSGATGHAPMISDGYMAAAQPQSPASYAGPYAGQSPYAAQPGQGTPATPYPQYSGQNGPSTWAPQPGGGLPSSAGGGPSGIGPGGIGPGGRDALAQYRPGSRNPGSSEIPGPVHTSLRLMYAGFAGTVAALITSLMVFGRYSAAAADARRPAVQSLANQMAGVAAIAFLADILGLVCWIIIAVFCRRGRGWTRVAGTVLFGLYTVVMLLVLLRTHNDPGARFTTLLVWALGVAAAIPLWTQQARDFFVAWRKH